MIPTRTPQLIQDPASELVVVVIPPPKPAQGFRRRRLNTTSCATKSRCRLGSAGYSWGQHSYRRHAPPRSAGPGTRGNGPAPPTVPPLWVTAPVPIPSGPPQLPAQSGVPAGWLTVGRGAPDGVARWHGLRPDPWLAPAAAYVSPAPPAVFLLCPSQYRTRLRFRTCALPAAPPSCPMQHARAYRHHPALPVHSSGSRSAPLTYHDHSASAVSRGKTGRAAARRAGAACAPFPASQRGQRIIDGAKLRKKPTKSKADAGKASLAGARSRSSVPAIAVGARTARRVVRPSSTRDNAVIFPL